MSSITSSVEPGEGGQRQPLGAPSHPSAPMGARSPPGATREGKSTCCHGMGPSGSVGAWSTHKMMLRPRDSPLMAPTCLLRVQGNPGDGCAAGRVAGGHGDLLGDTGHCRAERRPCGTTTGCTGRQRSLGDVWDVGGCGVRAPMEGLTIGPGRTDPHHLAAHQGHLQGHVLVPALGCDADVASDDGGDEGIGDLPVAVRVSFKDLPERVKRVPMAECPQAGGLQPPPRCPLPMPTLSSWPPLPL